VIQYVRLDVDGHMVMSRRFKQRHVARGNRVHFELPLRQR